MLETVGVTEVEERVYRELLRLSPASVHELAQRLGVDRRRVAAAVRGLEAKALAHHATGRPSRVVPAPPDVALPALIQRQQRQLEEAALAVEPLVEEYRRSIRERGAEELIELCVGREAVAQRFEQLQQAAQLEVRMFVMPPYATRLDANDTEIELLARGVRYRCVYRADAVRENGAPEAMQRYIDAGEQARLSTMPPMKLAIGDRSLALLPINGDGQGVQTSAMLVHPCGLLDTLIALFELVWVRAQPIVSPDLAPDLDLPLSGVDRQLMSLLLTGLTDRAAGRALGISERTVQRRVHAIMASADAQNRLQLGWQLAARGWGNPGKLRTEAVPALAP